MSKYIDADKLKAQIKVLQCEQGFDTGEAERAYQFAIKDILAFITYLQQEQPEIDFEKAYKSYMESRKDDLSGNAVTVNMKDLACHFYKLGLNARKEE